MSLTHAPVNKSAKNPEQNPHQTGYLPGNPSGLSTPVKGAYWTLGLLLAMNLFNYIDRTILAAVEPEIRQSLLAGIGGPDAANKLGPMGGVILSLATSLYGAHAERALSGLLASAFLVTYMISAPLFGALAQRMSRWYLIGIGVVLWSLATGAGGLASTFTALLLTRCFVGVGEGAYGPLAPALIADAFPLSVRGRMLSLFYIALPVGGALGYVLGGQIAHWDLAAQSWRWAFYVVVGPGMLLGLLSFFMREPQPAGDDGSSPQAHKASWHDLKIFLQTPSFVFDTLGMTAMTFAMGALVWWMPDYLKTHNAPALWGIAPVSVFGLITVVAGLLGTIAGGSAGDRLRKMMPGSYFMVSGVGLIISAPAALLFLVSPFPMAWLWIFVCVFFMFFNTGPTNAILANVIHPSLRPTAFAVNIFVIHIFGDVISPPLIGAVADRWNMAVGFAVVSVMLIFGGLLWVWGTRYLERDTEQAVLQLG
jgi:MFS family permease